VGRQARAGENVRVPPDRAWWPAVGPRLDRGVRPHRSHARVTRQEKRPRSALCRWTYATSAHTGRRRHVRHT
jgi:hypothetical protein